MLMGEVELVGEGELAGREGRGNQNFFPQSGRFSNEGEARGNWREGDQDSNASMSVGEVELSGRGEPAGKGGAGGIQIIFPDQVGLRLLGKIY